MLSQERELRAALDALSQHIALLDGRGRVLIVNRAWREFAADNGGDPEAVGVGANYLEVCDRARGPDAASAREFGGGLRDVLEGRCESFEFEYPCNSPDEERWFVGRVTA